MSTLVAQTISNGTISTSSANVINGAKAWVNFNGSGTVAIRASYNVSSITDNGTGDYTVNFTNAFADANYSVGCFSHNNSDPSGWIRINTSAANSIPQLTSSFRIVTVNAAFNNADTNLVDVQIFR
jgi:hypothetical protein